MGRPDRLAVIILNVAERRRDLGQQRGVGIDLPLGFRFLAFLKPEQLQKQRPDQIVDTLPVIRTFVAELIQNTVCQ